MDKLIPHLMPGYHTFEICYRFCKKKPDLVFLVKRKLCLTLLMDQHLGDLRKNCKRTVISYYANNLCILSLFKYTFYHKKYTFSYYFY